MIGRTPRVKILLLVLIVGSVAAVTAAFVGYRYFAADPTRMLSALSSDARLSLGAIQHTATRDGVKEWTLEASSAELVESQKQIRLKDLSVVYFLKNGGEVYLTAREGTLHTESNDIDVNGNVVVINEPYELKTESLSYRNGEGLLLTDQPVEIISTRAYLSGLGLRYEVETNRAELTGHVEGILEGRVIR
jgi:LPS export ABC transporter protein LptC